MTLRAHLLEPGLGTRACRSLILDHVALLLWDSVMHMNVNLLSKYTTGSVELFVSCRNLAVDNTWCPHAISSK